MSRGMRSTISISNTRQYSSLFPLTLFALIIYHSQYSTHLNECIGLQTLKFAPEGSESFAYLQKYFIQHYQSSLFNYTPCLDPSPIYDLPSSLHTLFLTTRSFRPSDNSLLQNPLTLSPLSEWIDSVPFPQFSKQLRSPNIRNFLTSSLPVHFSFLPQFLVESVLTMAGFYDPMRGYEDTSGFLQQVRILSSLLYFFQR